MLIKLLTVLLRSVDAFRSSEVLRTFLCECVFRGLGELRNYNNLPVFFCKDFENHLQVTLMYF